MSKVTILTDGGSDLKNEIIKKYNLTIVPYRIIFGEDIYYTFGNENTTITRDEFYARLAKCGKDDLPHTSVPSPGHFMKAFDEALDKSDSILAILLSSKQSGTIESAKRILMNQYPEKDIIVYDSNQIMSGIGVQVLLAAKLAAQGKSKEEIIARLNELNSQVRTIFVFQNLHYLYLGGRIGKAKKLMASALNMNPVLYVDNGVMEGLGVLTKRKLLIQLKNYAKKVIQHAKTSDVFLWHTKNKTIADEIYKVLRDANNNGITIHYQEASPLPAVYGGPHGLSISYVGDWDKKWLIS
ncbi:MAG: DegV family protein [Asgard group archaeon]|nr:DegV family protein [Asgard group archaeon]